MFNFFLKPALRNFRKNKTYSFLNIFGLAIGIACAGLIFLWAEDELTFDNVNLKKDRLYQVRVNANFGGTIYTMGSTPRLMAPLLKSEIPGIINAARVSDEDQRLLFRVGEKSFYSSGKYSDSALFSMFTLPFKEGNAGSAFAQLHSLVITEKAAKKFFGTGKNILGKSVRVDNKQDFIVSGIIQDLPENSTLQFEWLAPFENEPNYKGNLSWAGYGPFTYVELDNKLNAASVSRQLWNYLHRKDPTQKTHSLLFPMKDWRLYDEFNNGVQTGGGAIKQVRMLSAIAWIIFLIGCINFMNLATASSQKRTKEVGVRKVLGAEKKGLIAQFIGEAMLMSFMATIVAVIFILLALPAFNIVMHKQLLLNGGRPFHIIGLFTIAIICGLVAGSYPSLYLSSFRPAMVLKGIKLKIGNASLVRKGLVMLQFTVSVVFIISTIIVYMQIQHVKDRKLGFKKDNLIEIDMQHDISKTFPLIKQDLLLTGIIEKVALSDHSTIYGGNTDNRFKWQGKPHDNEADIAFRNVSPEFISASGMEILEGRDFNGDASSEASNVIISESMANLMGKESTALGKIIQSPRGNEENNYTNMTVVGVINDFMYGNMYDGKSMPVIYFCQPSRDANLLYLRIKPQTGPHQALAKIETVMKKDNPVYPLQFKFVDDQFNEMFLNETLTSKVSGMFAILAIIISCLGLFGLTAFTAEQRTKEIGIRKVLGASVTGLASLLSKDFLQLVLISCLVAFPLAWWIMHNWLQNYEYRISMSWWIFIAAGLVALLIALLTISIQTIKAAVANPVNSLRSE
jgi:putative ABC transport system permease protein